MSFIKEQVKRFFTTGKWALKLIFLVVLVELGIVVGAIATQELDEIRPLKKLTYYIRKGLMLCALQEVAHLCKYMAIQYSLHIF